MLKIYHNPRCKKSCAGLEYLKTKNIEFEVIKYMDKGLTINELKEILLKLDKKPIEIIRTQEELFRKELKGMQFTDDEWLKIITENPRLLQRPIVVSKYKAVIAQPVEEIDKLLNN